MIQKESFIIELTLVSLLNFQSLSLFSFKHKYILYFY